MNSDFAILVCVVAYTTVAMLALHGNYQNKKLKHKIENEIKKNKDLQWENEHLRKVIKIINNFDKEPIERGAGDDYPIIPQ